MKRLLFILLPLMLCITPLTVFAAPFAYITNSLDNTVSVIDTATNTVTATIPVGAGPQAVAVNRAGTKVYVPNMNNFGISVIDTATNTVTTVAPGVEATGGIAINSAGTRAYVISYAGSPLIGHYVFTIDTATNEVIAKVFIGRYNIDTVAYGIAVNPAGTRVYATYVSTGGSYVSVIDTATNTVIAKVNETPTGGIAVNPAGTNVYAVDFSNSVVVIDTASNARTATIPVGGGPYGIAINPGGTRVYVANGHSNNVSVINTASNTVIATVPVGQNPQGVSVTPDGKYVYVANRGSNNVSVIDAATNTVVATIAVGKGPVAFGQFMGPAPMPAPTTQQILPLYPPVVSPVFDSNPLVAKPFAVGDLTSGSLGLHVGLGSFTEPVDIYLAIYAPFLGPEVWLIAQDLSLQPILTGVKWRANTAQPVDDFLYGNIPLSIFPRGTYYLYVVVVPPGGSGAFYIWTTYFTVT